MEADIGVGEAVPALEHSRLTGAEIMTPAGEARLRTALQTQIAQPFDYWDEGGETAPGDRLLLGFGFKSQQEATIVQFNDDQAEKWFTVVEDEYNQARERGVLVRELSADWWQDIYQHEMDHLHQQEAIGLDRQEATLGIHFGYDRNPHNNPKEGLSFEIVATPPAAILLSHPADQLSVWLRPIEPSVGDCLRALTVVQRNLGRLAERPNQTLFLLRKLRKSLCVGPVEFVRLIAA